MVHRKERGLSAVGYAVVDVETTGLLPDWHHRIAEIAVVHLDIDGRITDEWCTLVNPLRDLGPQHVHRIRAADVRTAPTFAELAGDVAARLADRVLVAHNLAFDALFLTAEFQRAGAGVALDGLCTMRLSQAYLDSPSRSLAACCRVAGIPQFAAHSALDDARASAGLMSRFVTGPAPWSELFTAPRRWPPLPDPCGRTAERSVAQARPSHFLARLVDRLPRVSQPPAADDYLALLDRALVGRHLSVTDQDALVATATSLGLTRADVVELHRRYLAAVVAAAGRVEDEADRADLLLVASLLGLGEKEVDAAPGTPDADALGRFRLAPGDVVAFTGDMQDRREPLERLAVAAGLQIGAERVTRRTRLLVAADPDTLSGKASTARRYGIPIVTEAAFRSLVAEVSASTQG